MKVAVFGGEGFLGKYLSEELYKRSYEVFVFDKHTHADEAKYPKYSIDILNKAQLQEVFTKHQFDVVYNLAGQANLDVANTTPFTTMNLNILGNINVVEAAIEHKVKRYVYASSAYAMSNKGSFYGISKLASEKIIEEYSIKNKLEFTIIRYGSVYSEKNYNNNYIYNVVEKAIKTGKIEHGGDGNEVREYIHASDAAKLSVDIIESSEFVNQHVIFTGIEKIKRKELFDMINEILNHSIQIELNKGHYHNHYQFTPYSYTPTISKKLVANPHIDMGQGILECIKAVYAEIEK